jgi:pyruvate/2-oxoglutarate dehydrogenase complex dihydrolipoamide acyltransferase (E2) component
VAKFPITIPRLSVAISEATLVDVLVTDGEDVAQGQALYVLETEKIETEVDAGASGKVRWTGEVGTTYPIGTHIGVIEQQ